MFIKLSYCSGLHITAGNINVLGTILDSFHNINVLGTILDSFHNIP